MKEHIELKNGEFIGGDPRLHMQATEEEKREQYFGKNRGITMGFLVIFAIILIIGAKNMAKPACPEGFGLDSGVCSPCEQSSCLLCTSSPTLCQLCTDGSFSNNQGYCQSCDPDELCMTCDRFGTCL